MSSGATLTATERLEVLRAVDEFSAGRSNYGEVYAAVERILAGRLDIDHPDDIRWADAFCADCESLMVEDDGAGHLCPVCDLHDDCEDFPCGGYDDIACVLNAPLGSRADALAAEGGRS